MTTFNEKEIDEIFDFIQHTDGMSVDGKEIKCFGHLYSLVSSDEKASSLSKADIVDYVEQVNLLKDAYQAFGCGDCSLFEKILKFLEE